MNNFQTKLASEDTVNDFVLAAKSIAGTNISAHDELMLKSILADEKVTGGGIEVTFIPRKITVASQDFEAQYSRRQNHG